MAWEYRTCNTQLFGRSQLVAPPGLTITGRESPWASAKKRDSPRSREALAGLGYSMGAAQRKT